MSDIQSVSVAVACDIFLVRRSAHPRGAFLYIRKEHFPNI